MKVGVATCLLAGLSCFCFIFGALDAAGEEADTSSVTPPDTAGVELPAATAEVMADSVLADETRASVEGVASRPASLHPLHDRVEVFSGEELSTLASVSPVEVLVLDAGAGISEFGSYGSPQLLSLRYGRPTDIVYLLDGVPVSDPQIEVFDLVWLPLAGISGLEVAKGGLSSVHGSGAGSGAVNVVSADPMGKTPLTEVGMWWGGFDSRAIHIGFRRLVTHRVGILSAYENTKSGGWVGKNSYDGEKFLGKLSSSIWKGMRLEVTGLIHRGTVELPDSCQRVVVSGTDRTDSRDFFNISLAGGTETVFSLDYYRLSTSQQDSDAGTDLSSDGRVEGLSLALVRESSDQARGMLDMGFRNRELKSSLIGNESSATLHLSAGAELGSELRWLRGDVRVEWESELKTEIAPSLACNYSKGGRWAVFGRLDRSFRYPTFLELFGPGPRQQGDPDPGTEHSLGAEIGVDYGFSWLGLGLTAFWRKVDDMVIWEASETCERLRSTDSGLTIAGFELSGRVTHPLGFEGSVAFAPAHTEAASGNSLLNLPTSILTWNMEFARDVSPHVGLGFRFSGRRVSRVDAGNRLDCVWPVTCRDDAELPAYVSATLYGYIKIDRARVFLRIRNLFDDDIHHRWGSPSLPSRSYEFGTSWELWD
jgi:outer membrane cobalamin receptor